MNTTDPNPDATSRDVLQTVYALTHDEPHVAICCDSRTSWRRQFEPSYKAQRTTEGREPLYHQMRIVIDRLHADGFPIWEAEGFEADDVIASAVHALATQNTMPTPDTMIVSADKDLLALVRATHVTVKSLKTGQVYDAEAVLAKFGVSPSQMVDYLTIVGDASDNVKGVPGIGPKGAVALLGAYGTLADAYAAIDAGATPDITPAKRTALVEFRATGALVTTRSLITMRTDAPVDVDAVLEPRVRAEQDEVAIMDDLRDVFEVEEREEPMAMMTPKMADGLRALMADPSEAPMPVAETPAPVRETKPEPVKTPEPKPETMALAKKEPEFATVEVMPSSPREFTMELEPRSAQHALVMAKLLFASKLYQKHGSPEAIFAAILRGREMGFPAGASVDAFHVVSGKMVLDATAIRALVLKSGKVRYFRCIERSNEAATFEACRVDDDTPIKLRYTVEDAKRESPGNWKTGSQWERIPADMCVARASSKLARLVAPDVTMGLYAPEEMD
jgi:5'-3' exonuclease